METAGVVILAGVSVSVDGFIAYPDDMVGPLFDWYGNEVIEVSAGASGWTFHVSRTSADHVQPFWAAVKDSTFVMSWSWTRWGKRMPCRCELLLPRETGTP